MKEPFCVAPWVGLYLGNATIRPCCLWTHSKKYEWKTVSEIEKVWNSKKFQSVRQDFLDGKTPRECEKCLKRILPRNIWFEERVGRLIKKEINPPLKPLQIDLQLGNKCNLQCRMCFSWSSCKWTKDDKALGRESFSRHDLDISQLKEHEEMFSKLIRLDFKGGEPMMYESMVEMTKKLVEWGNSSNITLAYSTNCSIVNKDVIDLWKDFKEITLVVSIDGTGELFKYIRGFDINKIEENLYIYDEVENLNGLYNTAVSIYNILDIAEINHWIMSKHLKQFTCSDNGANQHFNCNVTDPPYLDVRILPQEYKELALEKAFEYNYPNMLPFIKWLVSIINIPPNHEQLKRFVSFTRQMDEIKGTNFLDIKPEFKDLFKEYSNG